MPLLETWYTVEKATTMSRMRLAKGNFNPLAETRFPVHKLDASNVEELNALYKLDEKDGESVVAFSPDMVKDGFFYGVHVDEKLIAAAGTHVVARQAGIAALGNVYTHMEFRNKGLGSAVSAAVVAALFEAGLETLVLNVAQDNDHAIKMYKRLGFEQTSPFVEGPARRR